jgi:hypothetical protein
MFERKVLTPTKINILVDRSFHLLIGFVFAPRKCSLAVTDKNYYFINKQYVYQPIATGVNFSIEYIFFLLSLDSL